MDTAEETPVQARSAPDSHRESLPAARRGIGSGEPVAASGQLQIVEGSRYLLEQEERKRRQMALLGYALFGVLMVALACGIVPLLMLALGVRMSIWWCIGGLALEGVVWRLLPVVERLKAERDHFAAGRRGEEELVELLRQHLGGGWTLFRNIVLPGEKGDIDAVLVGPRGIFALEVKAYRGRNRNFGEKWQRRVYGPWRTLDRNPTRQARRNAVLLAKYLKRCDIDVWVEPRVVWAGQGKLELIRPAVPVWLLANPAFLLRDVSGGKLLSAEVVARTVAVLESIPPSR